MIEVEKIKDMVLRANIMEKEVKKSVSEEDYIKHSIETAIKNCKSINDFFLKIVDYGITIEQYESKKDNKMKISFKTDNLKYGISEDKIGYNLTLITNKIKQNNMGKEM